MPKNINQIEFVGDLSVADAEVLARYGRSADRILEFGSGGSTQIFAQCCPKTLVSVETDYAWIERTRNNLSLIGHDEWTKPLFVPYDLFKGGEFDLIFVDGIPDKRLDFAMHTWPMLKSGGYMIFHDTRRFEYFKNLAWVMQSFFNEIGHVGVNELDSNMSVIYKTDPVQYVNWNLTENKPLWAYGAELMPEGASLWKIGN